MQSHPWLASCHSVARRALRPDLRLAGSGHPADSGAAWAWPGITGPQARNACPPRILPSYQQPIVTSLAARRPYREGSLFSVWFSTRPETVPALSTRPSNTLVAHFATTPTCSSSALFVLPSECSNSPRSHSAVQVLKQQAQSRRPYPGKYTTMSSRQVPVGGAKHRLMSELQTLAKEKWVNIDVSMLRAKLLA